MSDPLPPEVPSADSLDFSQAQRLIADLLDLASDPKDPTPGSIPGYTIEGLLGQGASGAVYRAFRHGSDRPVALKIIHHPPGLTPGSPRAQRAWRELSILSELRLACLPRILDYGAHIGGLYLASDLIVGVHVDRYCEHANLPLSARVSLLARLAECVQCLHERGVIHRDLKPSNILIDEAGQPFLIDFGLAAILVEGLDPIQTITADGTPLGTPAYMSPEQARGERVSVSPGDAHAGSADSATGSSRLTRGVTTRSDVYSLGAIGYRILTGDTPHDMNASLHEVVRRVAQDPPRDPRSLAPAVPRPLAAILRKACAPASDHRYASASELAEDLRRYLRGQTPTASIATAWQRAMYWAARHPQITTFAACLLIAAASFAVFLAIFRIRFSMPANIAVIDGSFAVLRSRQGFELGPRWGADRPNAVAQAKLITAPGGQLAAVRFGSDADPADARRLKIYDLERPDVALWQTDTSPEAYKPPAEVENPGSDVYNCGAFLIADVLSDPTSEPVDECICFCRSRNGPWSSIQIRELRSGAILRQFWHRGHLFGTIHWMPEARQLVFCAASNNKEWRELPGHAVPKTLHPFTIFGLDPATIPGGDGPSATVVANQLVASGERRSFLPEWHLCLLPSDDYDLFDFAKSRLTAPANADKFGYQVCLTLVMAENNALCIEFLIDQNGGVENGVPYVNALARYPHLKDRPPKLGPLPQPAIVPQEQRGGV